MSMFMLLSSAVFHVSVAVRSCEVHDLPFLNPCCALLSRLLVSRWMVRCCLMIRSIILDAVQVRLIGL